MLPEVEDSGGGPPQRSDSTSFTSLSFRGLRSQARTPLASFQIELFWGTGKRCVIFLKLTIQDQTQSGTTLTLS